MKEVSNYSQGDNVAAAIDKGDKYDNAMGNVAADAWSGSSNSSDKKGAIANDENLKCIVITDLYGDVSKKCYTVPLDTPGKPSPLEPAGKPPLKPEIPADGGLKDPIKDSFNNLIKDPIQNQSREGDIKKPMKPQVEDSIEFGEPIVKPAGKPGKVIKSSAVLGNGLD
ncbi:hypothetical protein KBI23_15005 [bacterium]|nr:hypothetical protein [bacterium]MBP9809555.1 hypothetical protein [bacterium]